MENKSAYYVYEWIRLDTNEPFMWEWDMEKDVTN